MDKSRDEFIKENIGLVHICVKKFANRGIEYDDLFQAGCIGLIKAYDNFDESLGYKFSTYAVSTIIGEIRQNFRNNSGSFHVSRSIKDLGFKIKKECEVALQKENRSPTVLELAQKLDTTSEKIIQAIEANQKPVSLSVAYDNTEEKEIDLPFDECYDQISDKIALKQILLNLCTEERKIIILRFLKNLTQSETARLLNTTQVQISRQEKKILKKMKQYL